ncbi:hypothetical protein EXN66_Car005988 [Channa argus]|uniref:Uncharacterized protein n=1 Tax=Channa argus TaxID=215402 RepID=A0A6G1PJX7_CHAAH|nr:hypothetical protein EXN66_Car005988 [Channa argus]
MTVQTDPLFGLCKVHFMLPSSFVSFPASLPPSALSRSMANHQVPRWSVD